MRKAAEAFAVKDANAVALAYGYFEDPNRRGLVNRFSGGEATAVA